MSISKKTQDYEKLCWWLLHDLAMIGTPVQKSTIRRDFCTHFQHLSDEETFGAFDLLVKKKFVNFNDDDNSYELRKEGYGYLKTIFDNCFINATTAQFFQDRHNGPAYVFCSQVSNAKNPFEEFSKRASSNVNQFMCVIRVLLPIMNINNLMFEVAVELSNLLNS